jgi:8-oxo-dGTP pyrophosphatase MutT (NUDIX family)
MGKEPIAALLFAVAIVRKADRFLLVHERKHGQRWYLPAGRVEPGESFAEAAVRETAEETGVPIRLCGLLRVEHSISPGSLRVRVVYYAEPADDTPPKQVPDEESLGAAWVSLDELDRYALRGPDVRDYFEYVARGGVISPLEVLGDEGLPILATALAPPR